MRISFKHLSIFILLVLHAEIYSQEILPDHNIRSNSPIGISLYGGSPTLITSIAVDYFISPSISIEAGAGLFGVYSGGRYHFRGNRPNKRWTTYTGLLFAGYGEAVGTDFLIFLPIGQQFIGNNGFNFAVELSLLSGEGPVYYPVWFGVKLGYRFPIK